MNERSKKEWVDNNHIGTRVETRNRMHIYNNIYTAMDPNPSMHHISAMDPNSCLHHWPCDYSQVGHKIYSRQQVALRHTLHSLCICSIHQHIRGMFNMQRMFTMRYFQRPQCTANIKLNEHRWMTVIQQSPAQQIACLKTPQTIDQS